MENLINMDDLGGTIIFGDIHVDIKKTKQTKKDFRKNHPANITLRVVISWNS